MTPPAGAAQSSQMLQTQTDSVSITLHNYVKRNGSGVELQTLYYEDPGSNPVLQC